MLSPSVDIALHLMPLIRCFPLKDGRALDSLDQYPGPDLAATANDRT
jgi:hypothetical protein